jgi:hypothetical protein
MVWLAHWFTGSDSAKPSAIDAAARMDHALQTAAMFRLRNPGPYPNEEDLYDADGLPA